MDSIALGKLSLALTGSILFFHAGLARAEDGRIEISHAAALAGNIVPGDAPGYPVDLGSATGSFVLTSNLLPPPDQSGIQNSLSAGGPVNIDLNGFEIRHEAGLPLTEGVQLYGTGNSVTSGTVRGSPSCVELSNTTGARVEDVEVRDCGFGIRVGPNAVVRHNRVDQSANVGISATDSLIVGNIIRDSATVDLTCPGCVRRDNLCSDTSCSSERRFYLTTFAVNGGSALTACGLGFHMASMHELGDWRLQYDSRLGDDTRADLGSGPPAVLFGWVRNGYLSLSSSGATGFNNCNAWSNGVSGSGTAILWSPVQPQADTIGSPWSAGNFPCSTTLQVWCVEDATL